MTSPNPAPALEAREAALADWYQATPQPGAGNADIDAAVRAEWDAAWAAGRRYERERLADRQQMVDEVKAELDDAFQFTEGDGSRHGYVTREWVQVLIATQAASAWAVALAWAAPMIDKIRNCGVDGDCPYCAELASLLRQGGEGGGG